MGIKIIEDEKEVTYNFKNVVIENSYPSKEIKIYFEKATDGYNWFKLIELKDEQAIEFYRNWTTHRQVYELLCDELGQDYSIILEDIEDEI